MAKFELPALPYAHDALEPVISAKTMSFHYDKHHRTYVDKLNELSDATTGDEQALLELVRTASGPLFNNAAQTWNHTFYWNSLAPVDSGKPDANLGKELEKHFGSVDEFKTDLTKAAVGQFGSGWAWLVRDGQGVLKIVTTSDAGNPLRDGLTPLLTVDVWEHAYYLDYQNARPKYVQAVVDRLINWQQISRLLEKA
jgi:superoxide dismutase, Fe-Mn family